LFLVAWFQSGKFVNMRLISLFSASLATVIAIAQQNTTAIQVTTTLSTFISARAASATSPATSYTKTSRQTSASMVFLSILWKPMPNGSGS
jgi:hypothetical protein